MSNVNHSLLNVPNANTNRAEAPEETNAIHAMNDLAADLNRISKRYDKTINKLQQTYNQRQIQYDDAYRQFQESVKYKVSDKELEKQRKRLQPYEDNLRSAGQKLNRVKDQKGEEAQQVLQQMQEKQNKYVKEQAAVIRNTAYQLQDVKKQYVDLLQKIGDSYTSTEQIDEIMKEYHKMYKKPYKTTVANELKTRADDVSLAEFEINADEIKKAFKKH